MKGVVFEGIRKVAWRDVEDPRVQEPTDIVVRVEAAGMCGSDLHPFFGRELGLDPGTVMGHEFIGRVVEKGAEVQTVEVGDRVFSPFSTSCGACFYCDQGLTSRCSRGQLFGWRTQGVGLHGGQAEYVRVPLADGTVMQMPSQLSPERALLLGDNWSTGYFCAKMASLNPVGLTVVIGCGTVGVLAIQSAKLLGAGQILALDPVESRRKVALELGATHAMAPGESAKEYVLQRTEGRGADSVLELVGLAEAQRFAWEVLRPGGTLSTIGCHSAPHFAFSPSEAYDKNLAYRTGRCPARHYMKELLESKELEQLPIDRLITHRFEASDCEEAYRIFSTQQNGCMKAMLLF